MQKKILPLLFLIFALFSFFSFFFLGVKAQTATLPIYDDALSSRFINWSWGSSVNLSNTAPTFSGTKSIAFTPSAWGALYFHTDQTISVSTYESLQFSIQASGGSPKIKVLMYDGNGQLVQNNLLLANYGGDPLSGSWKTYTIPVKDLGTASINGIAFQEISGNSQPTLFVDDIHLNAIALPTPTPTAIPTPTVTPTPTAIPTVIPTQTLTQNSSTSSYTLYSDSLAAGLVNWTWGANTNVSATQQHIEGTQSIQFSPYTSWSGLYLHTDAGINTSSYTLLHVSVYATSMNEKLGIVLYDQNSQPLKSAVAVDSYGGSLAANTWKTYDIPLSDLGASNKQIKGIVFQDTTGNIEPTLYVDDIRFSTNTASAILPLPTTTPTVVPLSGYTTTSNIIYKNGSPIVLQGISWFGFETGTHVVHGLWVRNWKEIITQIKSLGFTAVRVPFCPATLQGSGVTGIDYGKNPDLRNLNSLQIMDKVVNELNAQGLYILLDHHTPDCNAISDLWYTGSYSEGQWIKDLQFVANRYKDLGYFMGIDLKNEPKGVATWGTGNTQTDWNTAAEKAGNAVLSTNPNLLIFIQGIQNNPTCSGNIGHWQGGNLEPVNCTPIAASSIPTQKQVFSPHVYGPDVYQQPYFSDGNFPSNMPAIWDTHFGFLAQKGLTIVPGEWGGKYGTNNGDPKDVTLQNALVSYFSQKHICNSFYWDLNPNSGDTGGILQDDWNTPWPEKQKLLSTYFSSCK